MKTLIAFAALAISAFAQATTPAAPVPPTVLSALKTIIGTTLPADAPTAFVGLGVGVKNGAASGWLNAGQKLTDGTFLVGAEDYQAGNTSTRVGLEQVVYANERFYFSLRAEAGLATGAGSSVGASYGLGPSLAIKLPSKTGVKRFFAISASAAKSDVDAYFVNPKGVGQLQRLRDTITIRIGFLGAK